MQICQDLPRCQDVLAREGMESPQNPHRRDSEESDTGKVYDEFLEDLNLAHIHAQKAYDALFKRNGPKRSFLFRSLVGRAQSILISLYVQELSRKEVRDRGTLTKSE